MAQVFFVHCPRGIRISEAKDIIRKSCDCELKSAARAAFFVKVNSGDLKKITTETYGEEKQQFSVEISQKANLENWDELRKPFFGRRNEGEQKDGEKRTYKPREPRSGDVVKTEKKEYKPREPRQPRDDKPREPRQPREPREYKPREPRADKPAGERKFRAFVLPREKVVIADVKAYFMNTLKVAQFEVESKEGKDFHFFAFANLDDCRAARAAFREAPMENVTVRPFIPFHKRNQPRPE